MKKQVLFSIMLCILCVLFLILYGKKIRNLSMDEIDNLITRNYDINDFSCYFAGKNANESCLIKDFQHTYYSDVNKSFPIEVIRDEGYSAYAVNQGGYYYVFWSKMHITDQTILSDEPFVYFTAYLPSVKNVSIFDSLKPGISTAEDVKRIDPYLELSFLMSSGVFSYSFLDDKNVLEIEYVANKEFSGYDDLVVKELNVIDRVSAPTRYSTVLLKDLP